MGIGIWVLTNDQIYRTGTKKKKKKFWSCMYCMLYGTFSERIFNINRSAEALHRALQGNPLACCSGPDDVQQQNQIQQRVRKGDVLPATTHSPLSWFAEETCSWSAQFCATRDPPLSGAGSAASTGGGEGEGQNRFESVLCQKSLQQFYKHN